MGGAGSSRRKARKQCSSYPLRVQVHPKAVDCASKEAEIRAEADLELVLASLWDAVFQGDHETVLGLVDLHGHSPDVVNATCSAAEEAHGIEGDTPLSLACRHCHVPVVRALLRSQSVDLNMSNPASESGGTPLTIACENGDAELVNLLLADCRVEVNAARGDGCTPLYMASQNGHTDIVRLLLLFPGIDINKPDKCNNFSPLLVAAYKGRQAAVWALLEAKADSDARTSEGYNALVVAMDRRDPVLHAALLTHGADASEVHSALLRACLMGSARAARDALGSRIAASGGANPDAQLSPFHVACLLGDEAGLRAALDEAAARSGSHGLAAAAAAVDASGLGALYYAVELVESWAVKLLLEAFGVPESAVANVCSTMAQGSLAPVTDGAVFFRFVVMPFIENRIYVGCSAAKDLLLSYLGSVAAAHFFSNKDAAFKELHTQTVKGLRAIQHRLERIYYNNGLADALGDIGRDVPERPGGGRQDDSDLLPSFPIIYGYGPTATFYEDDYIDALQMLSCALDTAFYQRVENALCGIDCEIRRPPIKSRTRMRNKLGDPDDHLGKARPRPTHNIDTIRCAATCKDPRALISAYNSLVDAFGMPVRVKNSFRPEFDPSKSYGYRSVMMNVRFDTGLTFEEVFDDVGGREGNGADWDTIAEHQVSRETGLAMKRILSEWFRNDGVRLLRIAMAAEVQLILAPYLTARKESHLLYKVARCSAAEALVSDAASRAALGKSGGVDSKLKSTTRRMQERVAQMVEARSPAMDMSVDTIDLEAEDHMQDILRHLSDQGTP